MPRITHSDLQSYLDEALPSEQMAAIEAELRKKPELLNQLAAINARRDAGIHGVGEIWRRHRLSCPSREELGGYLLGVLNHEQSAYIDFHVKTVGCRLCQANVADLQRQRSETSDTAKTRRAKYFQSTAGHLRRK